MASKADLTPMELRADRVERAKAALDRGLATGHADEFAAARILAQTLATEARLSPEERARRERRRVAARTRGALAGPAAAYARAQKKNRTAA